MLYIKGSNVRVEIAGINSPSANEMHYDVTTSALGHIGYWLSLAVSECFYVCPGE
jgi:hypothetical protein